MLKEIKIAFIGAGQMGTALMKGMLQAKVIQPPQIIISDVNKDRLEELRREFQVNAAENNRDAVQGANVILLAVKPQQLGDVLNEIQDCIGENQTIISIAAGVSTKTISRRIAKNIPIIRVMPNSPALVSKGISVISPGTSVAESSVELVEKLFASVGEIIFLEEDLQNQAMALSGCGPAYFYYFVENLIEAGKKSGLDSKIATKLVIETLVGAGAMLKETGKPPTQLREMVTSPGGTTLAAWQVFEQADFPKWFLKAVEAAIKRAQELEQMILI